MKLPEGLQPTPDEPIERRRFKKALNELPLGDIPYLRDLTQDYRDDPNFPTELFFSMALLGYYDAIWGGLKGDAGHVIYRLADFIPPEEREIIGIYPSYTGSLVRKIKSEEYRWDSLEDWRKIWEKTHPYIPHYTKRLSENNPL